MSQDIDPTPEIPEDQWSTWGKLVLNMCHRAGVAISEKSTCPKCQMVNYHLHRYAEQLECQNPECKTRYPSNVARPPQAGETQDEHWRATLDALWTAAKKQEADLGGLRHEDEEAVKALTDVQRLLLAKATISATLVCLAKVLKTAEFLAEQSAG